MKRSILKSILGGVVLGTILFFAGPFLFFFLLAVFTLKFIFTPFGWGRMMMAQGYWGHPFRYGMGRPAFAFADKIRNMSDEEYGQFQEKMKNRHSCGHHGYWQQNNEQPSQEKQ